MTSLRLVEFSRPAGTAFWFPFEQAFGDRFNADWWLSTPAPQSSIYLQALDVPSGDELARIHLRSVGIAHYEVAAPPADPLGIIFFEVAAGQRRRGIGTAVMRLLEDRCRPRQLAAFSEGADDFWASLGWSRHLHADPDEVEYFRPLYVSPRHPSGDQPAELQVDVR